MSFHGQRGGAPQNQQLNPNLFTNQLAFGAMPAMSLAPGIGALVNQAAFGNMSNMNSVLQAAQRQLLPQAMQQPARQSSPPSNKNQRTFVGVVTKLMDTYGFVDEDVFFQTNVIRGNTMPRVGDRVMVEASYNPSMPFKWNAYRIQLIPGDSQGGAQPSQPPAAQRHVQPAVGGRWQHGAAATDRSSRDDRQAADRYRQQSASRRSPPRRVTPVRRQSPPRQRSPRRSSPRKSSPPRREPPAKRERERSPAYDSRESRVRSPTGSVTKRETTSPPRRRQRIVPRYQCYVPKPLISRDSLSYQDLHKRYTSLYIPSDFCRCDMAWLQSFPLDAPLVLSPDGLSFGVAHKDIDIPAPESDSVPPENPDDADTRYIVKVLLLAHAGASAVRQKMYGLLPDGSIDDAAETQPFAKNLQFLVGARGKEVMGIGGAWSPSLDGENPDDPQTQINTAVRTTHALTGIDLSDCPRWYKMVHLRYYRAERNRIDNVVLMMPDLSTGLMPTAEEYKNLEERIQKQLAEKIAAIDAEVFVAPTPPAVTAEKPELNGAVANGAASEAAEIAEVAIVGEGADAPASTTEGTEKDATADVAVEEEVPGKKKTHWSQLNLKEMKVAELRQELEARRLDSKGVKNSLIQRLQEALDEEKVIEEKSQNMEVKDELVEVPDTQEEKAEEVIPEVDELVEKKDDEVDEKAEKDAEELKKAEEKFEKEKKDRKAALERHYVLPSDPCVLVFPSKTAKSGKFDCKVMTLHSLLEYRQDDNKEASFEVFVFAEAMKEMLDRASAFAVYQTLATSFDKESERKRRDAALTVPKEPAEAATDGTGEKPAEQAEGDTSSQSATKDNGNAASAKDEKERSDPRTQFKAAVHDVQAFSAFAHFDQNLCGYLLERDAEEIVHSVGLDFTRGDVQRLLKKFVSKERINYRNLTDKWVDKEGQVKYAVERSPDAPSLSELTSGHQKQVGPAQTSATLPAGATPDVTDTGVVLYKGTVLNIVHTMEQHRKVDDERATALLKVEELSHQLKSTKEQKEHIEKKKRRLDDDVERYKKKLHDLEKAFKGSQEDNGQLKVALQDCKRFGDRISAIVDKALPPPKAKSEEKSERKEEKTEGSDGVDAKKANDAGENNAKTADGSSDGAEGESADTAATFSEPKLNGGDAKEAAGESTIEPSDQPEAMDTNESATA